ncbi:recombinase family protein [Rossellomorea oryzaecorticis]|uniref:Recombinase family protein n=1 Tax=Rossellomorea oryzaecorticis TaxID=1396505 RepID=A0ABU9KA05_9BACI
MGNSVNNPLPIKQPLAVASLRRSSHNQEGNQSFEIQKLAITEFAKRKGYYLPEEFIFYDDAVSAYRTPASKRQGLNHMKKVVLEQDVQAIIFYDFSRIDRKIYSFVSEFYFDVIAKKPDVRFFATTKEEAWTPKDLDVKLQLIFANAESNRKSMQAVDAQFSALKSEERRPGATVPFGYSQEKTEVKNQGSRKIYPNEDSGVVLFIFHLASWGYSLQKISDTLNSANIPSPTKKKWRTSTIENILKNPVYSGTLSWNFKREPQHREKTHIIEGFHPAIVPKTMYQMIENNRMLKQTFNKLETPFLFGGILTCNHCKNTLYHRNASTKKGGRKYSYLKYGCRTCGYELDYEETHGTLFKRIKEQLGLSIKINEETIKAQINGFVQRIEENLKELHKKFEHVSQNESKLLQEHEEHKLQNVFLNVKERISKEITEMNEEVNMLRGVQSPDELKVFLNNFQSFELSNLSLTEQRLVLLYLIKEVTVHHQEPDLCTFQIQFKTNPVAFLTNQTG